MHTSANKCDQLFISQIYNNLGSGIEDVVGNFTFRQQSRKIFRILNTASTMKRSSMFYPLTFFCIKDAI